MHSAVYEALTKEGKALVNQAMERLAPSYDPQSGMSSFSIYGKGVPTDRPSLYYALGLMLLGEEGCEREVEKICGAIIAKQFDAPDEIFHGAYRQYGKPDPKPKVLDYEKLGLYGRYFTDLFYERNMNAFRLELKADPRFAPYAQDIERLMDKAVMSEYPVVYAGYEPCSREFNLMCFAMLLEHFDKQLSPECVKNIERSCSLAVQGAITRSSTDFSPLNTNIQCMHVFIIDYFGRRLGKAEYCEYALSYAEKMAADYSEYHAAIEFNSPTYCGVVLSTLGFWQRYGSCERLREIGAELENGIWHDMMDFYNPAMRNFCGPYSRAYELEMGIHTAFHALFYLSLGEEAFPYHPFTNESDSNTLLMLGQATLPEDLKAKVTERRADSAVRRQFHELAERGEPGDRNTLCTATAWITPELMIGSLSGSKNPSYQLHPFVLFWRGEKGLGTIKLLRRTAEGKMNHLHYVYFDGVTEKTHTAMDIKSEVNRDIVFYYEIEYPDISDTAVITKDAWTLPGLTVSLSAEAPEPTLEKCGNILRVRYLSQALKPETKKMHFEMDMELTKEQAR